MDEVLDQPAEVVARAALGTKLAGDLLTAKALFFPSGRQALLPAIYWRSKLGAVTLQDRNSTVDPACFPEVQDEVAHAILHIDAVTDAFEPRWNLPEDGVTGRQPLPKPALTPSPEPRRDQALTPKGKEVIDTYLSENPTHGAILVARVPRHPEYEALSARRGAGPHQRLA